MKSSKYLLIVKAGRQSTWLTCVFSCLFVIQFGLFTSTSAKAQTDAAGRVMFVVGAATKRAATGVEQPVAKEMVVSQGDKLRTADDAHIYIRMADGALLVMRPQSSLSIDLWKYNPEKPEQSQIKYTLHSGLSRYVSGRGSQAAKDQFRFNTPLAAIGVRGTDFTVLAAPLVTEVSVRSGGVVVSGFGDSCKKDAIGPCEGRGAEELFASPSAGFLQLKAGEPRPQIVPLNGKSGPDQKGPALNGEPLAKEDSAASNSTNLVATKLETRAAEALTQNAAQTPTAAPTPAAAVAAPLAAWGRWGGLATDAMGAQIVTSLVSGRDLAAINSYYVLAKNPGIMSSVPEIGQGSFKLIDHEGIIINPQTGMIESTKAVDGNLTIDFGKKRFQTELKLQGAGQNIQIGAAGTVEAGGVLLSDLFVSPTLVQGLVGGANAGQASYIYRRPSSANGPDLSGAANWSR
jgi:hypothetical protein